MPKIQILNETQVNHFVDVLLPELLVKFNAKAKELEKLANEDKDNFATHAEVVELKEKQDKKVVEVKQLIEISKQLKEINKKYSITNTNSYNSPVTTEEELERVIKEQKNTMDDLLLRLASIKHNVNQLWTRQSRMTDELKARLSMVTVGEFTEIKEAILKSIDPISYFTNPITE